MHNRIRIKLHSMDDILNFIKIVMRYEEEITIYGCSTEFDAKSIMALFAMDYSTPSFVEIGTEDETITDSFVNDMQSFLSFY